MEAGYDVLVQRGGTLYIRGEAMLEVADPRGVRLERQVDGSESDRLTVDLGEGSVVSLCALSNVPLRVLVDDD
jgi:hypothetical protein